MQFAEGQASVLPALCFYPEGILTMTTSQEITPVESYGPKFRDRSGTKNDHGVKFLRPLGKFKGGAGYVAWECECPYCQTVFVIASNSCKKQQSCGCNRANNAGRPRKTNAERYHRSIMRLRHEVCSQWKDLPTFLRFCELIKFRQDQSDERRMVCRDHEKPLGPDNYVVTDQKGAWTRSPMVLHNGKWIGLVQAAKILGMTRQRAHQIRLERIQERLDSLNEEPAVHSV